LTLTLVNKPINLYYFYLCIHIFFIFYFFEGWTQLSSYETWTEPSQPNLVTGPSQWPGWVEQHACANARVLLHRASELKFTCTESMLIKFTNSKKQRFVYLVLETEDACSADGSSPMVSLYLPSVLILSAFPLRFSQRLLKPRRWWRGRPAVNWLLILGFSAGTKTMAKTNTPRRVAPWFFLFFRCFFFALFCALVGFSPFRSLLFAPYALFLPTVLPFFFFPFPPLLFFFNSALPGYFVSSPGSFPPVFPQFFFPAVPPALSHLLWLYSQRIQTISHGLPLLQ